MFLNSKFKLKLRKNLNDIWKINLEEVDKLVWQEIVPKGKLP